MQCIVEGCNQEIGARKMCFKHYQRWRKYGDPTIIMKELAPRGEVLRFLNEEVFTYDGDECFRWPYSCSPEGYGRITMNGIQRNVHVVVCEKVNGPRPLPGYVASHKCGKGHLGCCNPKHLKWQTWKEDRADMIAHGTWRPRSRRKTLTTNT
jgi:hypothetical protein